MANRQLNGVLEHVCRLVTAESISTLPDRDLLERFAQHGDEAAFVVLVQRHGPMVLGVCRRVLGHVHDAEDACQATFLILARKAASIRRKESLGSWLHGVAFRVAARLKRDVARRHAREGPAVDVPQAESGEVTWREVRTVLDEELRRLPKRFQAPLLLCYLEGKVRDEAARELGWSLGTLRGRLERGRELLRARLTRRGLTLSAALLGTLLTKNVASAAIPVALLVRTVKPAVLLAAGEAPAAGVISIRVAALMKGVLQTMLITRLKVAAAVVLGLSLVGLGAGVVTSRALTAQQPEGESAALGGAEFLNADKPQSSNQAPPSGEAPAAGGEPGQKEDPQQLARHQAQSRRNLRVLAEAMHNYEGAHARLPAPAIYAKGNEPRGEGGEGPTPGPGPGGRPISPFGEGGGVGPRGEGPGGPRVAGGEGGLPARTIVSKDGKPLLSWRVALLPWLEEDNLYRQFNFDEPWDSPHNKKLLAKMPAIYAPPGVKTREPYTTFYQVFVGPRAAFEKRHALGFHAFPDGTANTLLIVEAGNAVPWTKPEDLHFAPDDPVPELGGLFPGLFNAAFADGSVYALSKKIDADTLQAAIMRDDGGKINLDPFKLPVSRRETELKQQNERLRQELEREQRRLEELRREKKFLQEGSEDPEAARLKKENERLEQLLHQLRKEAEQLREEVQRLKRP